MVKRCLATALVLSFLVLNIFSLFGCSPQRKEGDLQIVCSIFPLYDWVREITADVEGVEVTLLIQNGTDAHSYQPTAEDLIRIASCDLLVYVGGTSEAWIEETAQKNPSDTRKTVELMGIQGITLREISAESHEDHGHDHDHEHSAGGVDEHLWLSLENASLAVGEIAKTLREMIGDEEKQARIEENATAYCESLETLDGEFRTLAAEYPQSTVLFADRFPFVYLTEEYGIGYVAAFRGCSTDAEAGFDTILRLADAIDENSLHCIVVTETSDSSLAESVRRATKNKDQRIVVMHSLQALTLADAEKGVSYRTIMEENLEILKEVLDNKPIS